MQKVLGFVLLVIGVSVTAAAGTPPVPEVNPASAGSAVALVSGALLIYRGRRS